MIPSRQDPEPPAPYPVGGNRLGRRSLWWYITVSPLGCLMLVGAGVGALWIVPALLPAPHTPPVPARPTPAQEAGARRAQMRRAPVAFHLNAVELGTSLSVDTAAAQNAVAAGYTDRILTVRGAVCEIFEDADTQGVVLAGPRQYGQPAYNLRCEVLDRRDLRALRLGQTVTVKGRFAGLSSAPLEEAILTDCLLVADGSAR